MKLPLFWLNDYVDISDISPKDLESKLFSCGFEVEEVIENGKEISKVVVGEVIECESIPGTHLHKCMVDVGSYGVLQICCGADNVKVGIKAPCALIGATVYDVDRQTNEVLGTFTIKAGKLRGYDSNGMLCSGLEIGVTEEMYAGASYDGLLILDNSCENGQDVKPIVGLGDIIFDIGVTANRPDCQSILGLAREVSAVLGRPLKMPDLSYEVSDIDINDKLSVEVLDSDLCPRYIASYVSDIKIESSPKWMQKRLASVGIRAINNIVDITNFVLMEIGQPMHSFDYANLEDNKIIVRRATEGEFITTLDDKDYTLNTTNLVICDGKKPQCIAGIMGGKYSSICDDTKDVVFECAMFKRDSIRKTSRLLGKRSDSSSRFEKGTDPYIAMLACKRALSLISSLKIGKIAKNIIDVLNISTETVVFNAKVSKINKVLGIKVPDEIIVDILTKLNFKPVLKGDDITLEIPPYRNDIEDYPDISEEIIRMYGYDNIVDTLLDDASITVGGLNKEQKDIDKAKNYLTQSGYNEIITYSFVPEKDFEVYGLDVSSDEYKYIKLFNPLGEDLSCMRVTLLPSMIRVIANNINKKNLNGKLFEFAKQYHPKALPLVELPNEKLSLCLGAYGDGVDFFTLKGEIEGLLQTLKATFKVDYKKCQKGFMHPTRSADIVIGNKEIGYFGEVNPVLLEKLGINVRVLACEIKYEEISNMFNKKIQFTQIPKYPSVERDIALICDKSVTNGEIVKIIKRASDKTLIDISLFDIYEGDQIPQGKKNMAYHLIFNSLEKSLTMEEVDVQVGKILEKLKNSGIELR